MCSEKKNHICHQRLTINERESIILMHTFLLHFMYVYRSVLYVCLAAHYDQVNDARMWMDRGNQAQYLSVEPKQKKTHPNGLIIIAHCMFVFATAIIQSF